MKIKRKRGFAWGCSIWLVCVIILELILLFFVPGCGLIQLSVANFVSGNAIKTYFPSHFAPPVTYGSKLSLLDSQGMLYASNSPHSYAVRMSDGTFLQKTENTFVAADGGIYYTYSADDPNTLKAVRVIDNALLWHYPTGGATQIQVINDVLYFDSNNNTMVALDARNGKLLWRFEQLPSSSSLCVQYYNCVLTISQVLHNIAYVTDGNELFVLRVSDGSLLWHAPYFSSSPLIEQDTVSVVTAQNTVSAFRASDGKPLWHVRLPIDTTEYLRGTADGNTALYYTQNAMYALQSDTGKVLWKQNVAVARLYPLGDTIYAQTDRGIAAFQAANGTESWQKPWNFLSGGQFNILGATQGLVFMQQTKPGGLSIDVMALNSASGQLVWQQQITLAKELNGFNSQGSPYVVINGPLSALLDATNIYIAYSVLVTNGPPPGRWLTTLYQPTYTSTYTIYVLALNAQDGSIKWRTHQGEVYTGCC